MIKHYCDKCGEPCQAYQTFYFKVDAASGAYINNGAGWTGGMNKTVASGSIELCAPCGQKFTAALDLKPWWSRYL